jgi:glutamine synthetase
VLTPRETESRYEVYAEQYIKSINVESNLMLEIAQTMIFPAAIRYQGELATSLANLKAVGIETDADTLKYITGLIADLQSALKALATAKAGEPHDPRGGLQLLPRHHHPRDGRPARCRGRAGDHRRR